MSTTPAIDGATTAASFADGYAPRPPASYSSVAEEYRALTEGVALLDRSHVGRLSLSGEDALDLLNRLSTNKLPDLAPGGGMPTVLTSNKGRIIDLLVVLMEDDRLLVQTAPETRQRVAEWVDLYTIMEDVSVRDLTEETVMPSLAGPKAAGVLGEIAGVDASGLAPYDSRRVDIDGVETLVVRSDFAGVPGFDLLVASDEGARLWELLLARGAEAGLTPAGTDALEPVRIERGVPAYTRELGEEFNPLEANLLDFISFDKGCYIGQEVVARLDTYKKVQKRLVGLTWNADAIPADHAKLLLDGKQVGMVTSAARSPRLGNIALAYVRVAHAEPGSALSLELDGEEVAARVAELPFTR